MDADAQKDLARCVHCGDAFVATGKSPCCSDECRRLARNAHRLSRIGRLSVRCLRCRKTVRTDDARQKFCSKSCAAHVNNKKFPKRVSKESKFCATCGGPKSTRASVNCSRKCWQDSKVAKHSRQVDLFLAGTYSPCKKNGMIFAWARQAVIDAAGVRCEQCGWAEVNPVVGKPILTLNHIDGNWRNNFRSNLESLCYNCHTLTPTFGALNIGSVSGTRPNMGLRAA